MHNGHKDPARLQAKFFMSSAFPPFTLCLKFQSFTSHFAAFRTFRLTHLFLISLQTERNRGIFSPFKPTSVQIHAYLSRQSILSFFSNMPMFERKGRHLFPERLIITNNEMPLSEEQVKVNLFRARQKIKQQYTEINDYGL